MPSFYSEGNTDRRGSASACLTQRGLKSSAAETPSKAKTLMSVNWPQPVPFAAERRKTQAPIRRNDSVIFVKRYLLAPPTHFERLTNGLLPQLGELKKARNQKPK